MGKVVNTYYSGISFSSDSRKWLFKIIYIISLVKITSFSSESNESFSSENKSLSSENNKS